MKTQKKKSKTKDKTSRIIAIDQNDPVGEIIADADYMAQLQKSMSVPDRIKFEDIEEGLRICKETGKLSEYSKLIVLRTELIDKYESTSSDDIEVCFDEYAVSEAAGA